MSMETTIGREHNLLEPTPQSARQIKLQVADPARTRSWSKLRAARRHDRRRGFKSITLPILFHGQAKARPGWSGRMDELCRQASARRSPTATTSSSCPTAASTATTPPIPALLAVAGVHHHLIREGTRTQVGLVLESGEPREVHHFALLIGYGAGAINPYLAFETLDDMIRQGMLPGVDHEHAVKNYIKAVDKGVLKVMSKMGISTVQSYRGAQIFEAIGLDQDVIDKYFTWTPSRIGGIGLDVIAEEVDGPPPTGLPGPPASTATTLDAGGQYQWRQRRRVPPVQPARRSTSCSTPAAPTTTRSSSEYSALVNDQSKRLCTLRGLFEFKLGAAAGPARGGRAGRVDRASASRPARCPTARSARRRTRRWPSP